MTEPGTAPLQHWRGGLCLGVLAGLMLGGAALADGPRDAPIITVATRAPEPAPASSGTLSVSDQTAAVSAQPAGRSYDADRQRRMLMLLVMRSAGSLGPYGALGH
jgi:hypothetical protein